MQTLPVLEKYITWHALSHAGSTHLRQQSVYISEHEGFQSNTSDAVFCCAKSIVNNCLLENFWLPTTVLYGHLNQDSCSFLSDEMKRWRERTREKASRCSFMVCFLYKLMINWWERNVRTRCWPLTALICSVRGASVFPSSKNKLQTRVYNGVKLF